MTDAARVTEPEGSPRGGLEELSARFEAEHDDYRSIIAKALADRLAEAFAEHLHEVARREWYEHGGKLTHEQLIAERFRGIRPPLQVLGRGHGFVHGFGRVPAAVRPLLGQHVTDRSDVARERN